MGNQLRYFRTPGGKLSTHIKTKLGKSPSCGDCGCKLIGIPALRPYQYKRLTKREKTVSRAYGGSRCGQCVRKRIMRAFLIEEQKCFKQVLAEKMNAAKDSEKTKSKKKKKLS